MSTLFIQGKVMILQIECDLLVSSLMTTDLWTLSDTVNSFSVTQQE